MEVGPDPRMLQKRGDRSPLEFLEEYAAWRRGLALSVRRAAEHDIPQVIQDARQSFLHICCHEVHVPRQDAYFRRGLYRGDAFSVFRRPRPSVFLVIVRVDGQRAVLRVLQLRRIPQRRAFLRIARNQKAVLSGDKRETYHGAAR